MEESPMEETYPKSNDAGLRRAARKKAGTPLFFLRITAKPPSSLGFSTG
jgi:hypothetical protein